MSKSGMGSRALRDPPIAFGLESHAQKTRGNRLACIHYTIPNGRAIDKKQHQHANEWSVHSAQKAKLSLSIVLLSLANCLN